MLGSNELVIINIFYTIEDPRKKTKNKLYPLEEILLVAFATLLSGGENYEDMTTFGEAKFNFFKTFLPFENGIPSSDTYERVFGMLNPKHFEKCLTEWTKHLQLNFNNEIISIDGKTVRSSRSKGTRPLHMVNAWANKNKVVLSCKAISEKSNEITAVPEVLSMLSLKGTITTMDAMGCQYALCNQIVEQEGDYTVSLKGNQGALHDDVKTFFELEKSSAHIERCETVEKDHGRIEKRQYGLIGNVEWLRKLHPNWDTIRAVGYVTSKRIIDDIVSEETRYFITSKAFGVTMFADVVRSHWGIENILHNFLDVALGEDRNRVRDRDAATNLSILRRMVVNRIAEKKRPGTSKRSMRLAAGWSDDYLKSLLSPSL